MKSSRKYKFIKTIKLIMTYMMLILISSTMILPFLWMLSTALKRPDMLFVYPPQWIPRPFMFSNFIDAWNAVPFARAYINTVVITLVATAGQVFTSSLAAYAFARLKFPGRDKLFFCYLATMMIPSVVTTIPVFIIFSKMPEILNAIFSPQSRIFSADFFLFGKYFVGRLAGINSYFALIAPGLFSAYGTFMLRQFFKTIPNDYEDAAKLDGCGIFGIYWRVILPMSKPALATLTIFTFMGSWKGFMWPLIIAQHESMKPIEVMLRAFQSSFWVEYHLLMAASFFALVPILVIFIVGQKYFMEGIRLGGLKG